MVPMTRTWRNSFNVPRLCGPDKIIIGNFHGLPQLLDAVNHFVHIGLRRYTLCLCQSLNLLAVLVRSRQESYIVTRKSLEPCHSVGHYCAVSVPYVQV